MIQRRRIAPGLGAALLVMATGRGGAKTAAGDAPEDSRSLAGQLLIAAPALRDPRFRETVIVLLRHGEATGALGVVINRPVGPRPLATLLQAAGESAEGIEGSITVHAGGPVQPEIGMLVHGADYQADGTLAVGAGIAMTKTTAALRDLGLGKGPARFLFVLGYAGWGPGQLEGELARGFWFTAQGEPGLVFDADREGLWERATGRRTRSL